MVNKMASGSHESKYALAKSRAVNLLDLLWSSHPSEAIIPGTATRQITVVAIAVIFSGA